MGLATMLLLGACAEPGDVTESVPSVEAAADLDAPPEGFPTFGREMTPHGITFRHRIPDPDRYQLPAVMGGGLAVFDADGDRDLDLYFIQGEPSADGNRLYLRQADGGWNDTTEGSGTGHRGHGMGCAVGDFDGDGDLDLFLTNSGPDALLRNDGGGRFSDVSTAAGFGDNGFSASAAFLDFDRDGRLDLYVSRYVDYSPERECTQGAGRRDFCGPQQFAALPDQLWHNLGDGRFEDISRTAGIDVVAGAGLGVAVADFDGDGWPDVYVANDDDPNQMWMNNGDGTFRDDAVLLGVALNAGGRTEAGMGLAVGDVDRDGDLDLFVTHLIQESNTLYLRRDSFGFDDATAARGLGPPSLAFTGFGTALFDADNDGDLDLAVANGGVKRRPRGLPDAPESFWGDYAEPLQLFANEGGDFRPLATTGAAAEPRVGRGLVAFDADRDGDLDLLVSSLDGAPALLRNDTTAARGTSVWLHDPAGGPLHGTVVERRSAAGRERHVWPPIGGYLTASAAPLFFAPEGEEALRLEVTWPGGSSETFSPPAGGVEVVVEKGAGGG